MMQVSSRRTYGILLVAFSAVLWSTAGLFVRMANLDTWTFVAWRSLFAALTLGVFAYLRSRPRSFALIKAQGWPGVVSLVISVISTVTYVASLKLTSVANVMTIYAALPFIATAFAYAWQRETVSRRFLVACSATLVGIAITTGAAASRRDILGILAALIMTSGFAAQLVYSKRHGALDMSVIVAAAAFVCALLALPFMQYSLPSPIQLLASALYGILTTGFAYLLVLAGGRHIASGEAAFVSLLDVVLGPLWVWLAYSETPTALMLLGGCIVLASVVWYLLGELPGRNAASR